MFDYTPRLLLKLWSQWHDSVHSPIIGPIPSSITRSKSEWVEAEPPTHKRQLNFLRWKPALLTPKSN